MREIAGGFNALEKSGFTAGDVLVYGRSVLHSALDSALDSVSSQPPDNTRPIASTKTCEPNAISSSDVFSVQW